MKKSELFPKDWTAKYGGHDICVHNSWSHGMKLYVDGDCRAATGRLLALSRSKPVLSHRVAGDAAFLIEVFCRALLTVKAKIVVDGRQIAGDSF